MENIKEIAWALSLASAQNKLDVPGEYIWAFPATESFADVQARFLSVFSSGNSIKDPEVSQYIREIDINRHLSDPWTSRKFEEQFPHWIKKSPHYQLTNLDLFQHACYSQGSQESFLNFYIVNRDKRFRIFKGEYWWHMQVWHNLSMNWAYIEDDELKPGDVCMVSLPFAISGDRHPKLDNLIEQCEHLGIELLLDFIYLPNSMDMSVNIDLLPSCIKTITLSFSKAFPTQFAKIAIRLSKRKINDPMQISNDENIANRLGCGLGLDVMSRFPPDFMVTKYRNQQQHWCKKLGLTATKVVHFAVGEPYAEKNYWFSQFNEQHNRYNLGILYENSELLKKLGLYD